MLIPYVVTEPAEEPVTLADVKDHLRIDVDDEDDLLATYISAARQMYEASIWRALVTQTLAVRLWSWPTCDFIPLPRPPLASVTSLVYTDSDGSSHTVASSTYNVYVDSEPGMLWLKYGQSWPTATLQPGPSIICTYVAGQGDAADVKEIDKQAIRLLTGHFYENREQVVAVPGISLAALPMAVQSIIYLRRAWS